MPDLPMDLAAFRTEDVTALLERESALLLNRCQQQEYPNAVLLAGQPGAGKTELSTMLVAQLKGGAAFLNGDDYRRYHPNYRKLYSEYGSDSVQMTSAFSSEVTERLIEALSDHHLNLVVEGTGRTVDVPRSTAEQLTAKEYLVEMAVIAARPEVSLISTLRRFYQMNAQGTIPRATALATHDAVVDALPANLDVLWSLPCISRIRIWDRELLLLFDSQTSLSRPSESLLDYWYRPWTADELTEAREQITELLRQENKLNLGQHESINRAYSATSKPLARNGYRAKMGVPGARSFAENTSKSLHLINCPVYMRTRMTRVFLTFPHSSKVIQVAFGHFLCFCAQFPFGRSCGVEPKYAYPKN